MSTTRDCAYAVSPFSVTAFFQNYMMIPVFLIMWGGYKWWFKTKWVNLAEADLVTGRRAAPVDVESSIDGKRSLWAKISEKVIG